MRELDAALTERLRSIGLAPEAFGDPGEAWRRLRDRYGQHITLIDRYALEAAHRAIQPDELDDDLRATLRAETLHAQFPAMEFTVGSERASDVIEVVAYDERWPKRYEAWRTRLAAALGPAAMRIEHVGSTAVPGLAAKPIIDIQLSVADPEDESRYVAAVESTGLQLRAREPGHRYFRPPADRPREVHLHVCADGSGWERDHLLFRDYLRAHPETRDAYADLKRRLARHYPDDRLAYTDAKSAFILDTLDEAVRWGQTVRALAANLDAVAVPTIVAALVQRGSQLLLVEQQGHYDPTPSWMLPGGKVDEGEDLIAALERELREETGLTLLREPAVAFVAEIEHRSELADSTYHAITYACQARGEPQANDPDGYVRRAAWVDADEALTLLDAVPWYEAEPLRRFLAGTAPPGARYRYLVRGTGEGLVRDAFEEIAAPNWLRAGN